MNSIVKELNWKLTLLVSSILLGVLFATDLGVDHWLENQFVQGMESKTHALATLVKSHPQGIKIDQNNELLAGMYNHTSQEYLKILVNGKPLSDPALWPKTLNPPVNIQQIKLNSFVMGESEDQQQHQYRWIALHIHPQFGDNISDAYLANNKKFNVLLIYAKPIDSLNRLLTIVDLLFVLATIITFFAVRIIVHRVVSGEMQQLIELNEQIKTIDIQNEHQHIKLDKPKQELEGILSSLNLFIAQNRTLLKNEKRLTSDIAHEIKTPIAELLSLTEVAIKHPLNEEIQEHFKPSILDITLRLKNLVNHLLSMSNLTSSEVEQPASPVDLAKFIHDCGQFLLAKLALNDHKIRFVDHTDHGLMTLNITSVEIVVRNLLENALIHSPKETTVSVQLSNITQGMQLQIDNHTKTPLCEQDIDKFSDALWQKDPARATPDNFGLGLSIVKNLTNTLNIHVHHRLINKDILRTTVDFIKP